MAIKRGSKVDKSFSSASMTDLIFLLLLFMLIATTLINPNAIKLILPKSSNQLKDKAMTTISIQDTGHGYRYYVETEKRRLARGRGESPQVPAGGTGEPYRFAALRQVVAFDEVVAMMRMAKACAFLQDRLYVTPNDVKYVFVSTCAHRLVLSTKAKTTHTASSLLEELLNETAMPFVLGERNRVYGTR